MRFGILAVVLAVVAVLVAWQWPDTNLLSDAFEAVSWTWVAVAVGINLMSVVVRSSAWQRRRWLSRLYLPDCGGIEQRAYHSGRISGEADANRGDGRKWFCWSPGLQEASIRRA